MTILLDGHYQINKSDFDSFNATAKVAEAGRNNSMEQYTNCYFDTNDSTKIWVKVEEDYTSINMTLDQQALILSTQDAVLAGMVLPEVEL